MSFKLNGIFPANPVTTRGVSTKLSAANNKVIYTNGKTVIIRDLTNPLLSKTYSGHVHNATVARFSPSGYYCASADTTGTVRIWDTVGEDQVLKGEYKAISGRINDLAWDGESKRIIAVGDGREKFGHPFMVDTGASTGEIGGHSKTINAVSIRHQRPFRAATAADDTLIVFHQGVPFKYDKTIKNHTKFVQDVQFAPSGDHFLSVGSDAKVFLYDGKTGDTIDGLTDNPHKGSIMASSWSTDSKSFVTSSADSVVALCQYKEAIPTPWAILNVLAGDVQSQKPVTTWKLGAGVENQQVGNTWSGERNIVSLSLSGDLNIFDPRVGQKSSRIISAPQKSITASALGVHSTFLGSTADGRTLSFSTIGKESQHVLGTGHSNLVSGLAVNPEDHHVFSVGYDDHVREVQVGHQHARLPPSFSPQSVATASQPKSVAVAGDGTVFISEVDIVEAFRSYQRVLEHKPKFTPSAIAASKALVAIGGEDRKVRLNEWEGTSLKEISILEGNQGVISALAFSPDGNLLASGDSGGRICLFNTDEKKLVTSRWSFHSARINSMAWTSDSLHCASGSLDTHVCVWSVQNPLRNIAIKNANPGGVNTVLWHDKARLISAGADACARIWDITFHT